MPRSPKPMGLPTGLPTGSPTGMRASGGAGRLRTVVLEGGLLGCELTRNERFVTTHSAQKANRYSAAISQLNSEASSAGLHVSDLIVRVNSEDMEYMSLADAQHQIDRATWPMLLTVFTTVGCPSHQFDSDVELVQPEYSVSPGRAFSPTERWNRESSQQRGLASGLSKHSRRQLTSAFDEWRRQVSGKTLMPTRHAAVRELSSRARDSALIMAFGGWRGHVKRTQRLFQIVLLVVRRRAFAEWKRYISQRQFRGNMRLEATESIANRVRQRSCQECFDAWRIYWSERASERFRRDVIDRAVATLVLRRDRMRRMDVFEGWLDCIRRRVRLTRIVSTILFARQRRVFDGWRKMLKRSLATRVRNKVLTERHSHRLESRLQYHVFAQWALHVKNQRRLEMAGQRLNRHTRRRILSGALKCWCVSISKLRAAKLQTSAEAEIAATVRRMVEVQSEADRRVEDAQAAAALIMKKARSEADRRVKGGQAVAEKLHEDAKPKPNPKPKPKPYASLKSNRKLQIVKPSPKQERHAESNGSSQATASSDAVRDRLAQRDKHRQAHGRPTVQTSRHKAFVRGREGKMMMWAPQSMVEVVESKLREGNELLAAQVWKTDAIDEFNQATTRIDEEPVVAAFKDGLAALDQGESEIFLEQDFNHFKSFTAVTERSRVRAELQNGLQRARKLIASHRASPRRGRSPRQQRRSPSPSSAATTGSASAAASQAEAVTGLSPWGRSPPHWKKDTYQDSGTDLGSSHRGTANFPSTRRGRSPRQQRRSPSPSSAATTGSASAAASQAVTDISPWGRSPPRWKKDTYQDSGTDVGSSHRGTANFPSTRRGRSPKRGRSPRQQYRRAVANDSASAAVSQAGTITGISSQERFSPHRNRDTYQHSGTERVRYPSDADSSAQSDARAHSSREAVTPTRSDKSDSAQRANEAWDTASTGTSLVLRVATPAGTITGTSSQERFSPHRNRDTYQHSGTERVRYPGDADSSAQSDARAHSSREAVTPTRSDKSDSAQRANEAWDTAGLCIEQRQQTEAAAARRQREVEERKQVEAELQRAREHAAREQQVADGRGGETAHSDVVVKEHQQGGGQTVREYRDGRREVIFPSGQRQITHRDGTEVTVFADDGRGRDDGYSHIKEKTTFPDDREKVLWTNGNIDMHYPDRTKETVLPSGEKQTTFPDGTTEVVTAKGLHIPAVLKPSRSLCSSDYHGCDSRALQAQGGWHWRSVEQLAEHLAEPFRGDTEKVARVLFRWVANNVAYDVKRLRQENSTGLSRGDSQTAATVMRTGLAVCEGYSRLMCALCDTAGVACKYIGGKSGNFRKNGGEPQGHGWNALSFDGGRSWHLCDVCWAAGSVGVSSGGGGSDMLVRMGSDGSTLGRANSGRVFSRSFDKRWWCTAPCHFVERHLPEDRGDQLLERPVSEADWMTMRETAWAPTTFATMNDGDEVLAPFTGVLRRGQRVEFRIFLAEDSPSNLKLQWGEEWGETLRSQRGRGGYVHSITVQARSSGTVNVNKQGPTRQTSTGTSTHYDGLAQWKVE